MGPAILARALRRRRRSPTRSRSTAARWSTPSSPSRSGSCPTPARAWPAPGRSWSARATPPSRCGRRWTTRACAPGRGSARPASTSTRSARAPAPTRSPTCARSPRALAEQALAAPPAATPTSSFARDPASAARSAPRRLRQPHGEASDDDRLVAFVGKLIVSKGVDLLIAAWPLVLAAVPDARLVVVGFGAYRDTLEALLAALARGDLRAVRAIAERAAPRRAGRWRRPALAAARSSTTSRAPRTAAPTWRPRRWSSDRVVLTGRLEHAELAPLLAACEAEVVPSHVPGGVRDGRRRGGRVRRAARRCRAFRARRRSGRSWRAASRWARGRGSGSAVGDRAVRDLAERADRAGCRRRRTSARRRATGSSGSRGSGSRGTAWRPGVVVRGARRAGRVARAVTFPLP